jgi:hypothetical protein
MQAFSTPAAVLTVATFALLLAALIDVAVA